MKPLAFLWVQPRRPRPSCALQGILGHRLCLSAASDFANKFSILLILCSRSAVSIAWSCRFMRGARPAAILGATCVYVGDQPADRFPHGHRSV
jgi:hypothetical protein